MRILQLTNKPPWPAKDGGAIAILNLTRGLSRLGHEVTVLSMNTLKHHVNPGDIPGPVRALADFRFAPVPAAISPFRALLNLLFSRKPYIAVRFISRRFNKRLALLLQEKEFDIVQLEGLYLCPCIPVIRKHSSAKIAYRAHNIESEIWQRSVHLASGPKKWYLRNLAARLRKYENHWINRYDLLVPITGRDQQTLTAMGNRKPSLVIPGGIDTEVLPDTGATVEFPSLFHLGSLEWSPNQEGLSWFLREVWNAISGKYPELRFHIAGRNAPSWLIHACAKPGVLFLGEVEDAYRFMASRAIMVVPLFSGSGMRIKILEGMALGKAIVSTSLGAEGVPVTHGSDIMIADNAGEFIRCISLLVENQLLCQTLGTNAKKLIMNQFDNLALSRDLTGFYLKNLPA